MADGVSVPETLDDALVALQANLPAIKKDNTADTGKYKYKYADLTEVSERIIPLLGPLGLAWVTAPNLTELGFGLSYELRHVSGDKIAGFYPLPNGAPQEIGSAVTYARRYALCAVTGVAPGGDDDDAKSAMPKKEAPAAAPVAQPPAGWADTLATVTSLDALQVFYDESAHLWYTPEVKAAFVARKKEIQEKAA